MLQDMAEKSKEVEEEAVARTVPDTGQNKGSQALTKKEKSKMQVVPIRAQEDKEGFKTDRLKKEPANDNELASMDSKGERPPELNTPEKNVPKRKEAKKESPSYFQEGLARSHLLKETVWNFVIMFMKFVGPKGLMAMLEKLKEEDCALPWGEPGKCQNEKKKTEEEHGRLCSEGLDKPYKNKLAVIPYLAIADSKGPTEYDIGWKVADDPNGGLLIEISARLVPKEEQSKKAGVSKRATLPRHSLELLKCDMVPTDETRACWRLTSKLKYLKVPNNTFPSSVKFCIDSVDDASEKCDFVGICTITHKAMKIPISLTIHVSRMKILEMNKRRKEAIRFVTEDGKIQITKSVRNGLANGKDPLNGKQLSAKNFAIAVVGVEGRKLSFSDNSVTMDIPKGALTKPTVMYCYRRAESIFIDGESTDIVPNAVPVDCSAGGTRFDKPVTLKFRHFICMDDIKHTSALQPLTRRKDGDEWFADQNDEMKIEGEWAIIKTYHFCSKTVGVQVSVNDGQELPRQQAHMSTVLASEEFDEKHEMPTEMHLLIVVMALARQMQPFVSTLLITNLPFLRNRSAPQLRMRKESLATKGIYPLNPVTVQTYPECYRSARHDSQTFCQRQLEGISNAVKSVHIKLEYVPGDKASRDTNGICRIKMEQSVGEHVDSILHQPDHRVNLQEHVIVVVSNNSTPTAEENDGTDEWSDKYGANLQ